MPLFLFATKWSGLQISFRRDRVPSTSLTNAAAEHASLIFSSVCRFVRVKSRRVAEPRNAQYVVPSNDAIYTMKSSYFSSTRFWFHFRRILSRRLHTTRRLGCVRPRTSLGCHRSAFAETDSANLASLQQFILLYT